MTNLNSRAIENLKQTIDSTHFSRFNFNYLEKNNNDNNILTITFDNNKNYFFKLISSYTEKEITKYIKVKDNSQSYNSFNILDFEQSKDNYYDKPIKEIIATFKFKITISPSKNYDSESIRVDSYPEIESELKSWLEYLKEELSLFVFKSEFEYKIDEIREELYSKINQNETKYLTIEEKEKLRKEIDEEIELIHEKSKLNETEIKELKKELESLKESLNFIKDRNSWLKMKINKFIGLVIKNPKKTEQFVKGSFKILSEGFTDNFYELIGSDNKNNCNQIEINNDD